jgi:hypothetical protein
MTRVILYTMRGVLSSWRLAAVQQALQRGKGGGDEQEAVCVKRVVGFLVLPNGVKHAILRSAAKKKSPSRVDGNHRGTAKL